MNSFNEFFYHTTGVALFVIAFTILSSYQAHLNEYIDITRSSFQSNVSYEEGYDELFQKEEFTYGEVIGMLMAGPSVNTRISVPSEFFIADIKAGKGIDTIIGITQGGNSIYSENYGNGEWNRDAFPYSYIPVCTYRRDEQYDSNGKIASVSYVKAH